MADLSQMIVRVVHKYDGRDAMRQARKDVKGVKDGAEELNASLVAAAGAFTAFATSAVSSFAEIETAMAKFASRAGWTLKRFRRETEASIHETARLTGTTQSLLAQATQEGISQGFLGGMKTSDVLRLQRQASKLHAAGQTNLLQAMRAGIVARQYGAPTADRGLEWIYAASQVGAGNPSDYANAFMDVAPGGSLLDIPITESLGALALVATGAPSLEEGATWISALYKTISMPMKDAQEMLKNRLGLDWKTDIPAMVKEVGGLEKFLRMVRDNFTGPEIFEMFGRQEAVKGLEVLTLIPGQLTALQQQVRDRAQGSPIDRAWADNAHTLNINLQRLNASFQAFNKSWGTTLVWAFNRLIDLLRWLLDGLTALNNLLGGIPAVLATIAGGLITLAGSMNLLRTTMGWLRNFGSVIGGGWRGGGGATAASIEKEGDRNRRNRNRNTMIEAGTGLLGAAGAAAWARNSAVAGIMEVIALTPEQALKKEIYEATDDALKVMRDAQMRTKAGVSKGFLNDFLVGGGTSPAQHGVMGWGGNAFSIKQPHTGFMGAGIMLARNKFTWIGLITAGMIGGFQWWWKKTAGMESNRRFYEQAGLTDTVESWIRQGGSLADAPSLKRLDFRQMEIDRLRHFTEIAEELGDKQLQAIIDGLVPEGNWLHRMIAELIRADAEAAKERSKAFAVIGASVTRAFNWLLGVKDDDFDREVEQAAAEVGWLRQWMNMIMVQFTGRQWFGPTHQPKVPMGSIDPSDDWFKKHGNAVVDISDAAAQSLLDNAGLGGLPTFEAARSPHYDPAALLRQKLRNNPEANFNITINVENMNESTPEEVGKAVEKGAAAMWQRWGQTNWNDVTDDQDAPTY